MSKLKEKASVFCLSCTLFKDKFPRDLSLKVCWDEKSLPWSNCQYVITIIISYNYNINYYVAGSHLRSLVTSTDCIFTIT